MRPDARIGQQIRQARLDARLTLAEAAGSTLTASHLCMIERGSRGIPAEKLQYLAERLDKTVAYFLIRGARPEYLQALVTAGDRLLTAGESSKALVVLLGVLPAIPPSEARLAVGCRNLIGDAYTRLSQYDLARPYLDEALQRAEAAADPYLIGHSRNVLGRWHLGVNDYPTAVGQFEAALAALQGQRRPDRLLLAAVRMNLGWTLARLDRLEDALAQIAAAECLERDADPLRLAVTLHAKAAVLRKLHRYDAAWQALGAAHRILTRAERPDLIAYTENGFGFVLLERGQPREAIPHFRRAERLCALIAHDRDRAKNLTEIGRVHLMLHEHDGAMAAVQEAIRLAMKLNDDEEAARAEALRGEILLAQKRFREAEAACRFAIPIFDRHGQHRELAAAYGTVARALQGQGRHAEASDAFALALSVVRAGSMPSAHADLHAGI